MPRVGHKYRIELQGVEPLIWRKIVVPSDYSFWHLHVAVQDAMGWRDYHLHEFLVANPDTGTLDRIGIPDEYDLDTLAGWEVPIAHYFRNPYDTAKYSYDFGDDWQHSVVYEGPVELTDGQASPACLGGERACPPEDCGGPYGYKGLLKAINDPDHEQHAELLEWSGGPIDVNAFSASEVKFDDPDERWQRAFGGAA